MSTKKKGRHFSTLQRVDVPQGRHGKHKAMVTAIIEDLNKLEGGAALKIALAELDDTKENVRSALNRATRKQKRKVATAADDKFLYVWNVD